MNEYSPFYIIVFMFIFSVFIVLKAYEHQLKLKQKTSCIEAAAGERRCFNSLI